MIVNDLFDLLQPRYMLSARQGWMQYKRLLIKMLHADLTALFKNAKLRPRQKDNVLYDEGGLLVFLDKGKPVQTTKEGKDAGNCTVAKYLKLSLDWFSEPNNIADNQQHGKYLLMGFEIKSKFESDPLKSDSAARFQNFANVMEVRYIDGPRMTGVLSIATENTSIFARRNSLEGKSLWEWNAKYSDRYRLLKKAGILLKLQ